MTMLIDGWSSGVKNAEFFRPNNGFRVYYNG